MDTDIDDLKNRRVSILGIVNLSVNRNVVRSLINVTLREREGALDMNKMDSSKQV